MTLIDFLLARIAEDADRANHAKWAMQGEWFTTADDKIDEYIRALPPARVLAECEAKRRIVAVESELALSDVAQAVYGPQCSTVLRALAAIYADHPDYREEWKL